MTRPLIHLVLALPIALGTAALLSGLSIPAERPERMTLTGALEPGGAVRLAWNLAGPAQAVTLVRSTSRDGLADTAGRYPATRWTLPAHQNGAWQDAAPADGVTYYYQLGAETREGVRRSPVLTLTIPARALPTLRAPALRIDKRAYVMSVLDAGKVVKRYPVALGQAPTRRKLHFDNASTPEGVYQVAGVQPRATYHRAYDLSYPNALDRVRYRLASAGHPDFPAIGGEVQIHGRGIETNWTFGCVALRDADMDELFGQPAIRAGTEVRIWGGELSEQQVAAMAAQPPEATLSAWQAALAKRGYPAGAPWGPELWEALGKFQRAEKLPVTCQPDAATARRLGLERPGLLESSRPAGR